MTTTVLPTLFGFLFLLYSAHAALSAVTSSVVARQRTTEDGYLFAGDGVAEKVVTEYKAGVLEKEKDFTKNEEVPRVLEFYSPWCGACQLFAPKYIALAQSYANSKPLSKTNPLPANLQFHAISCYHHQTICDDFDIKGYPTLLVLPPGGNDKYAAVKVSRDVKDALTGKAAGSGYTLNSLARALEKAEANLDVEDDDDDSADEKEDEEEEHGDDATVATDNDDGAALAKKRRLDDSELDRRDMEDDDKVSDDEDEEEGGINGNEADEAANDDDQNSPDDEIPYGDSPDDPSADEAALMEAEANAQLREDEDDGPDGAGYDRHSKPLVPKTLRKPELTAAAAKRVAASATAAGVADEDEEEESPDVDDSLEDAVAPTVDDDDVDSEEEDEEDRAAAAKKRSAEVSAKRKAAQKKKDFEDEEEDDEEEGEEEGEEEEDRQDGDSFGGMAGAVRGGAAKKGATSFGRDAAAARGEEDSEEGDEEAGSPPVIDSTRKVAQSKIAPAKKADVPTIRSFAAIKKDVEDSDDDNDDEGNNTEEKENGDDDQYAGDDDETPARRVRDDDVPSIDDEEDEDEDEDDDQAPPLPGAFQRGRPAPFGTGGAIPSGPAGMGGAARASFLAKTGMQPKDIGLYQKIAAQRRADLAKRAKKRLPSVFEGRKKKRARREAAKVMNQSAAQKAQDTARREAQKKALLDKRVTMAKEIREKKKMQAGSGYRGQPTSERVRSQGGPPFAPKLNMIGKKPSIPKKVLSKVPVVKRAFKSKPEEDLYHDAALSFITGLKMGVYVDGRPLDQKRQKALISWLELLSISLPPELGLHALIDDLLNNISYISEGREKLFEMLDKYPLAKTVWSDSCSKGKRGQGNNCGLWKLLHIVTIGFAEHRGGLEHDKSDVAIPLSSGSTFTPNEGAAVIREYIALFYACEVCKNNFLSKYDDCVSFGRCDRMPVNAVLSDVQDDDWKEFPLWLWEFHNHISARIVQVKAKRDGGKDDEVIGIWPNTEQCFACFNEDGSWNMPELYAYLENIYWYGSTDFQADKALKEFDRYQRSTLSSDGGDGASGFLSFLVLVGISVYAFKRRKIWLSDIQKNFGSMPISRNGAYAGGKKA